MKSNNKKSTYNPFRINSGSSFPPIFKAKNSQSTDLQPKYHQNQKHRTREHSQLGDPLYSELAIACDPKRGNMSRHPSQSRR